MLFIEYSLETQVSGLLTLICVLSSFFFGAFVLRKAIVTKEKSLYYFFFLIIFSLSPWYSIALGYLLWLLTKEALSYELHIILNLLFVPIGYLAWFNIYLTAINLKKKKLIIIINGIYSLLMEFYMFYFLYFATNAPVKSFLGTVYELQPTYADFLIIYSLTILVVILITGIHFSIFLLKKDEIQWKGRLLLVFFIMYFVEVSLDVIISNKLVFFIIFLRSLLLIAIFLFYLGIILPIEETQEKLIQEKPDALVFLKLIAKRKKNPLTENEITFYKEQKICLVCKSKLLRLTYICPDCEAIYCITCVKALSDLENACWVCKSPFDPSKPVRLIEFEDEDLIVETDETKKKPEKRIAKKPSQVA